MYLLNQTQNQIMIFMVYSHNATIYITSDLASRGFTRPMRDKKGKFRLLVFIANKKFKGVEVLFVFSYSTNNKK